MLIFKYWVKFDENGEISHFYKDKPEGIEGCSEYLVKLIPIDRTKELGDKTVKLEKNVYNLMNTANNFNEELKRLNRTLKLRTR